MEFTTVFVFKVFISAVAIAALLDMYIVQCLKGYSTKFSSLPFINENLRWFNTIPLARLIIGDSTISYMKTRTLLFPFFELVFGGVAVISFYVHGVNNYFFRDMMFILIALPLAMISWQDPDSSRSVTPDFITLPGMVVGVFTILITDSIGLINSILGIAVGGGILYAVAVVSRGGVGGGAIKACAMVGAFLGFKEVLLTTFVAVLLGSVVGVFLMILRGAGREDKISFVPFIVIGGIIAMFWGPKIISWYMNISGLG